jgi:hypothetical protein
MKAKSVQTRSHNETRFASRARTPRKTLRADYQRCISARDELATFEAMEAGRDTRDAPRIATRNRSELRTFYSCCAFSCGLMEGKVRSQEDAFEATCTIGRCRNSSVRCFSGSRRVIRQHNKNTVLFCRLVDCLFTNTLLAEGQATTFGQQQILLSEQPMSKCECLKRRAYYMQKAPLAMPDFREVVFRLVISNVRDKKAYEQSGSAVVKERCQERVVCPSEGSSLSRRFLAPNAPVAGAGPPWKSTP